MPDYTTQHGIRYPLPDDFIRDGRPDQSALVDEMRGQALTVNSALSDLKSVMAHDYSGGLSSDNLNNYRTTGIASHSGSAPNTPSGRSGSLITVEVSSAALFQLDFEYGNNSKTWSRFSASSGDSWTAWQLVSDGKPTLWQGESALQPDAELTETPPGIYTVWAGSTATTLGMPTDRAGILYHYGPFGASGRTYEMWQSTDGTLWTRTYVAANFPTTWTKVGPQEIPNQASGAASGTKVIPLALTLGGGQGSTGPQTGTVVIPTGFNAPILRWRLAVRDANPRFPNDAKSNPTTFTNIRANGQTVIPTASMPAGTDPWYTPWINGNPNESIGFQYSATTPPNAIVGGGTINGTSRTSMPFEIWVEAETPSTTPVVAVIGDSNACGVGTSIPVHDSWISQYCRRVGALPVHYAASGDAYRFWTNPEHYKWNRWQHLDKPDVVIMALGSNDAGREGPASEIIDDAQTVWGIAAEKVSQNQHAITIKPRNSGTAGYNAARRGYNDWIMTQPEPLRAWHDMVSPVSSDDVTMDAGMYAPDGTHMTTAGHNALADSITVPVAVAGRQRMTEVSPGIYEIGA